MDRSSKIALGCGGFVIVAGMAGALGYWSMVAGMNMTSDPEEVRARTAAILVDFTPPDPLAPFFARRMERQEGSDEAVVWAVDSRYQNLLLVMRQSAVEPASAAQLAEWLTDVHPSLKGFQAEEGEKSAMVRIAGAERTALIQTARTVDEGKQSRSSVAFPYAGRWILLMVQGDGPDAGPEALQRLLDRLPPPPAAS